MPTRSLLALRQDVRFTLKTVITSTKPTYILPFSQVNRLSGFTTKAEDSLPARGLRHPWPCGVHSRSFITYYEPLTLRERRRRRQLETEYISLFNATPSGDLEALSNSSQAHPQSLFNMEAMRTLQTDLGLDHTAHLKTDREPGSMSLLSGKAPSDVVFLAIDLEAHEFAHHKITEIGISIFDARLAVTDPSTWTSQIKTRHLRISEYRELVNKRFVHGCPDAFNFGTSEFIKLADIQKVLVSIFEDPCGEVPGPDIPRRQIVLVGHALKNDIDFLSKLGFSPLCREKNILRTVDTQTLCRSSKRQQTGLSKILAALEIGPTNLHNAGNDAHYTLQAMLMMAIQHTEEPGAFLQRIEDVALARQMARQHKRAEKVKRKVDSEGFATLKSDW